MTKGFFSKDLRKILEHRFFATLVIAGLNFVLFNWIVGNGLLSSWNYRLTDSLYNTNNITSKDILIVAIDDKSLQPKEKGGLGRWQEWSRMYYAQALQNLERAGARVIGLDILFIDPSQDIQGDQALRDVIQKFSNILLASKFDFNQNIYIKPLDFFYGGDETKIGPINIPIDVDNIARKMFLYLPDQHTIHESFDVKMVKKYLGEEMKTLGTVPRENDHYVVTNHKIRLDFDLSKSFPAIKVPVVDDMFMYINFFGAPYSYSSLSFADVYHNRFDPNVVKNKIVLIGEYGATGLHDVQYTPVSKGIEMPGVEIHANTIQTLLERKFLRTQDIKKQVFSIGVVNLFTTILFLMIPVWLSTLILLVGTFLFVVMAVIAFNNGLLVNVFYIPFSYVFVYVLILMYKYLLEFRQRTYLKKAFSHYVSPQLVDHIIRDSAALTLGGMKKEISVLFSDIQGFTNLSEKLKPEEVVAMLNSYLEDMTKIVFENKGTLDKYIGDAIMAFWGAPLEDPEHAYHACLTAMNMHEKMEMIRQKFLKENGIELRMRIGINTGDMIVGNVGSSVRFDYTVIGDNVNLASRLEGANKIYGTSILISDRTYQHVQDKFEFRELDIIRVKGKQQPVIIYELIDHKGHIDVQEQVVLEKFQSALSFYRQRKWKSALALFQEIIDMDPQDGPSKTYMDRCLYFQKNPPPATWDGVFEMQTK
jgi:adenylate cyclase